MTDNKQIIKETVRKIRKRPVEIGIALGFDKLHPIDENGYSLHNEWIKMMLFAKEDILIQAHRESFKTTCVIVALTLGMILFPNMAIGFFRKKDDDVKEVLNSVKKCLQTDVVAGLVYNLYGTELRFTKESSSELTTNLFIGTRGVSQLTGLGIGSSLAGKHFDRRYTDDICNLKDRVSKAEREATIRAYGELGNVLNDRDPSNPYRGVGINTGTPWHRRDVYTKMPSPMTWDYTQTGILSESKIERQKKALTKAVFAANYLLEHVNEDDQLFTEPKFTREEKKLYYPSSPLAHVDCAFGGDNYTALTIINKVDDRYIGFGKVWNKHVKKCYGEIKKYYNKYKVDALFLEDNADKGYVEEDLSGFGIFTKGYHESQNKHVKIATYLYAVWEDIYWIEDTDFEYLAQIKDYTEGMEPDDAPDSCASLLKAWSELQEAWIL